MLNKVSDYHHLAAYGDCEPWLIQCFNLAAVRYKADSNNPPTISVVDRIRSIEELCLVAT